MSGGEAGGGQAGGVGKGVTDVAGAGGGMVHGGGAAGEAEDGAGEGVDAGGLPAGDVENAGGRTFQREKEVGGSDVADADEVAGLFAVPVNAEGVVGQRPGNEGGHGGGVGAVGILARAEYVEVAETDGGQSVLAGEEILRNSGRLMFWREMLIDPS